MGRLVLAVLAGESGRSRSLAQVCWVVLVVLGTERGAFAQSNFDPSRLGGRTAMMGGAAVATGADEATAFMNPAGITRIPGQSFSFTTFAIQLSSRTIQRPLDPNGDLDIDKPDVVKQTLRFIPNTFCLFLDGPPKDRYSGRSRHKYALCAATTERERMGFTRSARANSGQNLLTGTGQSTDMEFIRSSVVLTWGLALTRYTSIGVTFRTDNTRFQDSTTATAYGATAQDLHMHSMSLARDAWSWDTSVLVGMTTSLSSTVTLGASLATPSQHLFGSYQGVSTVSSSENSAFGTTLDKGDFRYNLPGSLRLGMAFSWPRLSFEVNASFYGPQAQRARATFDRYAALPDDQGAPLLIDRRASVTTRGAPVTNLAIGMEYFLRRNFSLMTGLNTDLSGLGRMHDQLSRDVLFRQRKDSIHAGVGVNSYGERGSILVGLRGTYSWGEAMIADPTVASPVFRALPQSEWGLSLVLSGRINFHTVREVAVRAATPLVRGGKEPKSKSSPAEAKP